MLALVANTILGATTAALTYALAFVMTGRRRAARLAALAVLLFAPFYVYEVLLLKTTAATTLATAALLTLMLARQRNRTWLWLVSGLAFGWLALLRGNTLVVLPFIAIALVVDHLSGRLASRRFFLWIAAVIVGILPATVHNIVAASDLVLTTYQGGTQFWIGNHPGASGTYVPLRPDRGLPGQERFDAVSLAENATGQALFPSQVSSFWFRRGLDFVAAEPGDWLALMFRKTGLFLNNTEVVDVVHIDVFAEFAPHLRLAFLPFGVLAALAVAGVWLRRGLWWWDLPVWAVFVGSLLSVVLFFVFGRYRVPVAPLLAVLAGAGIDQLATLVRVRRLAEVLVAAALFSIVVIIALLPVPEDSPLVSYNTLGGLYLRQGRADEARECFERVVAAAPGSAGLRVNLALAYERLGDPCTAAGHRLTAEGLWRVEDATTGDLVVLVQYLENAAALQQDTADCPGASTDPTLGQRAQAVAKELDDRQRQGVFVPSDQVAQLINRFLVTSRPGENGELATLDIS